MGTNRRVSTDTIRDNRIYHVWYRQRGLFIGGGACYYRRRFASGLYTGPRENRPAV